MSIVGFGNVCRQVIDGLAEPDSAIQGLEVVAIGRRERALAESREDGYRGVPFCSHEEAIERADAVIEAAVPDLVPWMVERVLALGRTLVVVSAAGLLEVPDLEALDRQGTGRLIVANGMIPGLDLVRAARESGIDNVRLTSRIKPDSLRGEGYIVRQGITLPGPGDPEVTVFDGDARTAAREFPRHFNVAVALSLAGAGLDGTHIQVIADPQVRGAKHRVRVSSAAVDLDMTSYGYPSPANPKTSRLVAPSVISTVRDLTKVVRVGS
ncbi:MAG: DUF108 domain-containing protein [Actinobacteria bacterium]|nr:DUF108 domain-containing protein [Actinomycetota bacterium]